MLRRERAGLIGACIAATPDILVQGPGRSKMIIGGDYPRDLALPLCLNPLREWAEPPVCASSVLVEGDAEAFARDFHDYARKRFSDPFQRRQWAARLSKTRFAWLKQFVE